MSGARVFTRWDPSKGRVAWDADACAAAKAHRTCGECGISIAHLRSHAKWCGDACGRKHRVQTPSARPTDAQTLRWRLRKYGMSVPAFAAMLDQQDGACAICRTAFNPSPTHTDVHVDHAHDSGVVRGLLCTQCNVGIGMLGDDVERIMSAASYLLSHENVLVSRFA